MIIIHSVSLWYSKVYSLFLSKDKIIMNIQSEKIHLAKLLLETENPKIIESIKKIFYQYKTADFWDDLSSEQKAEIDKASLEIKNGEVMDYEMFMEKHR
jgi:hypothetical protein